MKTSVLIKHQLSVRLLVLLFTFHFSVSSLNCFSQLSISPAPKTPDNSAILDVSSSTKGVLINRMNTAQRNAITPDANAASLLIFNTDTKCFEAYVNGGWYSVSCPSGCTPPAAPVATGASNVGCTSFTANWNPSPGAIAYYIDISTDNFITFVSGYNNVYAGNVTSFNVAGLTNGIMYYYRVRSATGCFSGNSNAISQTTACPCTWNNSATYTVSHTAGSTAPISKTITYNQTQSSLSGTSVCWITQNLGADHQGTSVYDPSDAAGGWYWQFNRTQGYDIAEDGVTRTPNSAWNSSINESSDWTAGNDPCTLLLGSGWRLPTISEWTSLNSNAGWHFIIDSYNSVFKIHASGYLRNTDGILQIRGINQCQPWSSNQNTATTGKSWYFGDDGVGNRLANPLSKAYGRTVRCLKP
jgi:hypothetical protein